MTEMNKDLLAQKLYNEPFERLSAFGQERVNSLWNALEQKRAIHPIKQANTDVLSASLEDRIEFLSRRLANLEMEAEELWIENSQLKAELASVQSQINQRSG